MKKVFVKLFVIITLLCVQGVCLGSSCDMSCDEAAALGIIPKSECRKMKAQGLNTGRSGNLMRQEDFQQKCPCGGSEDTFLLENKAGCNLKICSEKPASRCVCPRPGETEPTVGKKEDYCSCLAYCRNTSDCMNRGVARQKLQEMDCCCSDVNASSECCAFMAARKKSDYAGAKWISKSANPPADGSPDKNGKCCKADEINQVEDCCEKGNVSTEVCCKKEGREWNAPNKECCEKGKVASNGHCCEKGKEWIDAFNGCCQDGKYCKDTNQCGECEKCTPLTDANGNPVLGPDGLPLTGEWCEECN